MTDFNKITYLESKGQMTVPTSCTRYNPEFHYRGFRVIFAATSLANRSLSTKNVLSIVNQLPGYYLLLNTMFLLYIVNQSDLDKAQSNNEILTKNTCHVC